MKIENPNRKSEIRNRKLEIETEKNENKERKEEKQEKVSFLTALFEGRKNQSISQRKNNTPKRKLTRRKKEKDVDFNHQRKIDSYLIGNKEVGVGTPSQVKRKRENNDEKEIGMLITPKKFNNRKE